MCVFLRGEGEVSGSYKASGIPLKPLRITPGKGVVPVPGSLLPRMAPVDQHSPIENIWRILKQRVKRRKARNQKQLRRFIEEEWDKLTIAEINKYVSTMEERVNQYIDREEDVTES